MLRKTEPRKDPSRGTSTVNRQSNALPEPTRAERKKARTDLTPPEDNPKLYDLLQLWIHDRVDFKQACKTVGLRINRARDMIRDPKVRAKYDSEFEVLRTMERVPSVHRLMWLRDNASSERVQLEAARVLLADQGGESARVNVSVNVVPGYVIDLSGDANQARVGRVPEVIDATGREISVGYERSAPDTQSGDDAEEGE